MSTLRNEKSVYGQNKLIYTIQTTFYIFKQIADELLNPNSDRSILNRYNIGIYTGSHINDIKILSMEQAT